MQQKNQVTPWWVSLDVSTVQRLSGWRETVMTFSLVLVVWGLYRMIFRLPVWMEEGLLKAIVFGVPVWWQARRHGWNLKHLGMSGENLFPAAYFGLLLGLLLGMAGQLGNILRYGQMSLASFGLSSGTLGAFILLSLITGFWEQLLFSGYMLRSMYESYKDEWSAVWVTAGLFVVLHLPALLLVQRLGFSELLLAALLLFSLQFGAGILRLRLGNLAAPMLAQALWGVTVYLFR